MKFPPNFLWGAATSAYQVEGGNLGADWWHWEKARGLEPSGDACRHYVFYDQDFELARELGHNAHRFSVEWSRVEPHDGVFSQEAIQHYKDVVLSLRSRGIEPIVTLHHFTNPLWLARLGGWEDERCVGRFARYADVMVRALASDVRYWVTINEPTVYAVYGYVFGIWPPEVKSLRRALKVSGRLAAGHARVYGQIHRIYKELGLEAPSVGVAQFTQAFVPCTSKIRDRLAAWVRDRALNFHFIDQAARQKALDFIGINYYARQLVETRGWRPYRFLTDTCRGSHHSVSKNALGWDIYPEGLAPLLARFKKYGLPVIITENGICTGDDEERWRYIRDHLQSVQTAMSQGVSVRGYLYWSLLDNFEWDKGYAPRFGLIDIDYKTNRRRIRESAKKFANVCRTGELE